REQLVAVIRQDAMDGIPPTVLDDGRWYAAYPGFRDDGGGLADACFDVTPAIGEWAAKLDLVSVRSPRLTSDSLTFTLRGGHRPPGSSAPATPPAGRAR